LKLGGKVVYERFESCEEDREKCLNQVVVGGQVAWQRLRAGDNAYPTKFHKERGE
jgi:hypothetical protein